MSGDYVPFVGIGHVAITSKFRRVLKSVFLVPTNCHASRFGPHKTEKKRFTIFSFWSWTGCVTFRKKILPAVKLIGRKLFVQSLPELMGVATNKKSPSQATKSVVKRNVKGQIGGSASVKKSKPVKRNSRRKKKLQRSLSFFFSRVKNVI